LSFEDIFLATPGALAALEPVMKNFRFVFVFPWLSASLLLACSAENRVVEIKKVPPAADQSGTVPAARDAATFCQALCDREQACDTALDHQTCKNSCTNKNAAVFPKLREDVVDLIVTCFDAKDCKTVLGGSVVETCASEAVASVAPSEAATKYCEAYGKAKTKCGITTAKADCLNQAKLYGDGAIAEAQNCAERSCTEIDACVAASFGGFGASSPPKNPTNSCSGKFTDLGTCSSCAETTCCAQATACAADSSCRAILVACANGGTSSSACYSAYSSASTSSRSLASAFSSCAQSGCTSSCGLPSGG
jgi:hypothetical protein